MTRIESKTVQVNKSAGELYRHLSDFKNFHTYMPESVDRFESDDQSFLFGMKGMPEVRLIVDEMKEPEMIRLKSASSKLDFSLTAFISPKTENTCECRFEFVGNFNMMIRMMVEKPLKNFIENLADKVSQA